MDAKTLIERGAARTGPDFAMFPAGPLNEGVFQQPQ
jgi:hypothetical protein